MKRAICLAAVALVGSAFFTLPSFGGGKKKTHLDYQPSYEAAMAEARLRGVPIYYARHKDF